MDDNDEYDWRKDSADSYALAIAEKRKELLARQPVTIHHGDCLDVLLTLAADSIDACCTDPPYHLTSIVKRFGADNAAPARSTGATGVYARASAGFMGQKWDGGDVAFRPETWAAVLRVLKPGAHLVAFGAPRNYHRMACAIEDAGFEIRDSLMYLFGSGFPKSHDVSKAIDKAAGERGSRGERKPDPRWQGANPAALEGRRVALRNTIGPVDASSDAGFVYEPATDAARKWQGWGTALKPAYEPIILARKPFKGTVAGNVLMHGTAALNIDACRIETDEAITATRNIALGSSASGVYGTADKPGVYEQHSNGRWPANIIHDGSDEVLRAFPAQAGAYAPASGQTKTGRSERGSMAGHFNGTDAEPAFHGDAGSAARFFYTAKASASDRLGSKHPTVKPVDLIAYLCRLITPPGGLILDPFAGSGTTGMAAMREGFRTILIEREAQYVADIKRRLAHVKGEDAPLFAGRSA